MNKATKNVICTCFGKGRMHDFKLFKRSRTHVNSHTQIKVDTGYQGIGKLHVNTAIPKKKSKKVPLTKQDKLTNRQISKDRVLVENVIREMKIFRIIAEKYRNRRKRYGLRFNLIAACYNKALNLKK